MMVLKYTYFHKCMSLFMTAQILVSHMAQYKVCEWSAGGGLDRKF